MKKFAKTVIRYFISHLPWGAREAVFDAAIEYMGGAAALARIAPKVGNVGLWADGEYGIIQSQANDAVVLPEYANTGTYGGCQIALLAEFFESQGGGTYFDIGGNIGLTTIPIARNSKVKCLTFEPDVSNFKNLVINVARNCPHGNVSVHNIAIFERKAEISLGVAEDNLGDHRIAMGANAQRKLVNVAALPLDEFLGEIEGPVAVKIDTQGAEPYVVAGGRAVLSRASIVILEFSPYHLVSMGSDPSIIFDFLSTFENIGLIPSSSSTLPIMKSWREVKPELERALAQGAAGGHRHFFDVVAMRT
jgi:FkbM family methyltransferase